MTKTPDSTKLLYTPDEASAALSISARKLWALTASGEMPHIRIGRSVRYPVVDLQSWIEEQKTNPNQEGATK